MKKFFYLSFVVFALSFSAISCSDDDDDYTPPPVSTQLEEVISSLEKMEGVSEFTSALKEAGGMEIGNTPITVFAVKDAEPSPEKALNETEEDTINKDNIKRHIIKGNLDLSKLAIDSLTESIDGNPVVIANRDGKIFVNNVEVTNTKPTEASNSYIYVVGEVIESNTVPKYISEFTVYAINEEWAEGGDEKAVAKDVVISFYLQQDSEYRKVDSLITNAEGQARLYHNFEEDLYYTVQDAAGKSMLYDNYLVTGLFTTQEQIDAAPEYATGNDVLDDVKLGSLIIADVDGDGIINANDRFESGFFTLDKEAKTNEPVIVSPDFGRQPEE